MTKKQIGLAGVEAGESAISTVHEIGSQLNYRGYSIEDLTKFATFEEVAYLLLYGHLPTEKELTAYVERLISLRTLPPELKTVLKLIPKSAHPMDVLRTACSMLGTIEPETKSHDQYHIADRLLALFPGIVCYWYAWHYQNKELDEHTPERTVGGHFLYLLHGKTPHALHREAMNISLIVYAEHEFNASTFAARVTAATLSDFYSAITSAIGTLRGPLHGGANEAAMDFLAQFHSADEAERNLLLLLDRKEKIMGFGHRVYKDRDPRSDIIKVWALRLGTEQHNLTLYEISERVETVMKNKKDIFPNVDFYSADVYHYCGIPTFLFTPLFVISRITGWSAHVFEQRANNRLIRPLSIYTGPEKQQYISIKERK